MTRFHKITIAIFCGGILLSGIGAGVAFGEFSSLSYGGTEVVSKIDTATKEISRKSTRSRASGSWMAAGMWSRS